MQTLRRSFIYTLIIYALILTIFYLISQKNFSSAQVTRTKIDPAQFKMVPKDRFAAPKKEQQPKKEKQKKEQPQQRPFVTVDPDRPVKTERSEKRLKSEKSAKKRIKRDKFITLPKKSNPLLDSILNSNLPQAKQAQKKLSPQEKMLHEVYGDDFVKLSTVAKEYLNENHLMMQVITQRVLNRIGRIYIDPRFNYYGYNFVEFTLFPDGSISKIKLLKDAGFKLLDKVTKETIETAYKDYPAPKEPVLVRYKFLYDLRPF